MRGMAGLIRAAFGDLHAIVYRGHEGHGIPFKAAKQTMERVYCEAVLKRTRGNVTKAAELSGLDRKAFYDLMIRTGLKSEGFHTQLRAARRSA